MRIKKSAIKSFILKKKLSTSIKFICFLVLDGDKKICCNIKSHKNADLVWNWKSIIDVFIIEDFTNM